MNTREKGALPIIIAIAAVFVIGGAFYLKPSEKDDKKMEDKAAMEAKNEMEVKSDARVSEESKARATTSVDLVDLKADIKTEVKADIKTAGEYKLYSAENLNLSLAPLAKIIGSENSSEKVVLFFNASWCPTCKAADKEFKSSKIPDGVTILSVDYDLNTELRKKYGVTYQHTFVQIDGKGEIVKKWSGGGVVKVEAETK